MNEIIKACVPYVQDGKSEPALKQADVLLGKTRLRIALIMLLSWMKSGARGFRPLQPLPINTTYSWCQDLTSFLEVVPGMGELIVSTQSEIHFAPEVSSNDIKQILTFVDTNFRPPLMTKS
jgi:hypothetical protein